MWLIELLTIRGGAALQQQGGVFFAVFRGGAALLRSRSPTLDVVRFVGQAIHPCQC